MSSIEPEETLGVGGTAARYRWYHKVGALLFIFFCFELGVFLLVFPWLEYWDANYFAASFGPAWREVWTSAYFRGGVSGVGLVNVCIALLEGFRLRRFSE